MKKIFLFASFFISMFSNAQDIVDYLSAPFPSDLIANHQGNEIAWVFNNKGSRNIFISNPAKNDWQQITNYIGDDGIEINSLQYAPNDSVIYFLRGNSMNGKGEAANPAQLQYSTEQNIFSVSLITKQIKKIARGNAFVISPNGDVLLFIQGGKPWSINLQEEGATAKPLFLSRGTISALHFNKMGTQVSFVSNRDEHAFIGVYTFSNNTIQFLDPSTYVDSDPVWNLEGTKIAFLRRPYIRQDVLFDPKKTAAQPWQIRVVDVQNNIGSTIFTAEKGKGSVLVSDLPAVAGKLLWTKNNEIIFPWEKKGWLHLYSIGLDTKKLIELTPGIGEVETMRLANDGMGIYYVSNIADSNRRHIWYTPSATSNPQLLTPGKSIEYAPVELQNGIAFLAASAIKPAWPFYKSNSSIHSLAANLFPKEFPSNLVTPKTILVKATDQKLAPAQIFLPNNYNPNQKYPALIFLHGGSRRQMLEGFNYSAYYSNAYAVNEYFASKGYIVMSLNYRSGIGYGLEFREADHYGMTGGTEVNDLIGAGEYLKSRKDVDGKRIALWGGSYGGYLTAHGLARRSDLFAVGVDIHGVHNWNDEEPTFTPWYDSLRVPAYGQIAYKASPVYYASGWKSPVLFMHGDDDRNVPFTETVHMIHQLRRQGVEVEEKILPDEIHGFLMYKSWLKVDQATFEFINRKFTK